MSAFPWLLSLLITLSLSSLTTQASSQVPPKFLDPQMTVPAPRERRFSNKLIENKDYIRIKSAEWKACHQRATTGGLRPYALGEPTPLIEDFTEAPLFTRNLSEMEKQNLLRGEVASSPWSADYWPYAGGILGARYQDRNFTSLEQWLQRFEFIQRWPVRRVLEQQGARGADRLSPAEKYDLLVGDTRSAFAASMWLQGKAYYDQEGKVEEWMGICHGWAAAAIVEPRPVKSVQIQSRDQKWTLSLNPSEIKGLVSYSWATNPYESAFLGQRCNDKDPRRNKNGRLLSPECFDLNPSTWHLAIVHMVGLQKRSFVMDATFDYEVWNQPIVHYSYSYFNPRTRTQGGSLTESLVNREEFKNDPFAEFRSREARSIVGVVMKVGYVVETDATSDKTDSPEFDAIRWVQYRYDLELNAQGDLIGGEWHTESHPDFIWVPKHGARPLSPLDSQLQSSSWQGPTLPDDWAHAARQSSPRGVILNSITETLLLRAKEP